jgi:hypothetical protein
MVIVLSSIDCRSSTTKCLREDARFRTTPEVIVWLISNCSQDRPSSLSLLRPANILPARRTTQRPVTFNLPSVVHLALQASIEPNTKVYPEEMRTSHRPQAVNKYTHYSPRLLKFAHHRYERQLSDIIVSPNAGIRDSQPYTPPIIRMDR